MISFRDNRNSLSLKSPGSELWSLGSPFSLGEKNPPKSQQPHRLPEVSPSVGKPQPGSAAWAGVERRAFQQPLPAEASRCGQAHSWEDCCEWAGPFLAGRKAASSACQGLCACVCVCVLTQCLRHRNTPPHMPTTHTPKAIVSNYNLSLQAYGQMDPGENAKVQIDFLKSEKGHGLWVQTDLSSNPSSATY